MQKAFQDSEEDLIYINVDEVHVPYDLSDDYALHFKGERSIDILGHSNCKTAVTFIPCVASTEECLPPLMTFSYPYAKHGTRTFPKEHEKLKNMITPYMVRFTESSLDLS